ncbi:MAG TPA: hypothetical protein P5533_03775, partial [Candidatus Cloacimonadota bacterium]|nr:hypothetical protein [Candidatus Cloacimonadota bacterium]
MKARNIIIVLFVLLMSVGMIYAQVEGATQTVAKKAISISPSEIVSDSGWWGYLIILTFVIGIVYAIVRYIQLYVREKIDAGKFYLKLKGYLKTKNVKEAID